MGEFQDVIDALRRATQNMYTPGGYVGESKLSELFTEAGCSVFDKAVWDARVMAKYIQSLLYAKNKLADRHLRNERTTMQPKLNPPYKTDADGANVYDRDDTLVCTTAMRRMSGTIVAKLLNEHARLAELRDRLVDAVIVEEATVNDVCSVSE